MTQTLRDLATREVDSIIEEYGKPIDSRRQAIERRMRSLAATGQVPDDILETMPEVSRHNHPQDSPQEHECGCVTITRITDRDYRHKEEPFEMRLAIPCAGAACELAHLRQREPDDPFTSTDYQRELARLERRFLTAHGTHAEDIDVTIRRGVLPCTDPLVEEWTALQALAPYLEV